MIRRCTPPSRFTAALPFVESRFEDEAEPQWETIIAYYNGAVRETPAAQAQRAQSPSSPTSTRSSPCEGAAAAALAASRRAAFAAAADSLCSLRADRSDIAVMRCSIQVGPPNVTALVDRRYGEERERLYGK